MSLAELDHTLDDVENSRLLTIDERPDEPIPATRSMRIRASRWQAKSPGMIILLVAVIKFCIVVSGMMIMLPVYRLIEDAICHVHYEDDSLDMIEEMKCKVDEVQSRLAVLLGWLGTSSSIIGEIYPHNPCGQFQKMSDAPGDKASLWRSHTAPWRTASAANPR